MESERMFIGSRLIGLNNDMMGVIMSYLAMEDQAYLDIAGGKQRPFYNSRDKWLIDDKQLTKYALSDIINKLPTSLKILEFNFANINFKNIDNVVLPPTLTHFVMGDFCSYRLSAGMLPHNLKYLWLGDKYFHPLTKGIIPTSVIYLRLVLTFKTLDADILPPNLEELVIDGIFNSPLPILPKTLIKLNTGSFFDHHIPMNIIPHGLKYLRLSNDYNKPLTKNTLPSTITHLWFGHMFNQSLEGVLPKELIFLRIGKAYCHTLEGNVLPKNVKTIQMDADNPRYGKKGTRYHKLRAITDARGIEYILS